MDWTRSLDEALLWRAASVGMLAWLAFFFGRTLRRGRTPLIERIARIGDPAMTPALERYTRTLTAVWCAYFVAAAVVSIVAGQSLAWTGAAVWAGTFILFVGEHRLRPRLFPGHPFPGLRQQLRDTWSVWRPRKPAAD